MKKLHWTIKSFNKIMLILCLTGFSLSSLTVSGQSPWTDDFESYTSGTWPPTWVADGNATDLSSNYIDNTIVFQGTKSLRMHGVLGGSWAALAYHPISLSSPYEVEVIVRNGDETLTGAHPNRGDFGLRQGTSWVNPARTFVTFKGDGTIESCGGFVSLGTYSTLTWYTIKVRYERPTSSQVKLSYWINGIFIGDEILAAITNEDQLDHLQLEVGEGTVWFDNVAVNTTTGMSEKHLGSVEIYPNPAYNELYIKFRNIVDVNISIFNSLGQNVYTSEVQSDNETINISELNEGVYFVVIKDLNGNILLSERIIKV